MTEETCFGFKTNMENWEEVMKYIDDQYGIHVASLDAPLIQITMGCCGKEYTYETIDDLCR